MFVDSIIQIKTYFRNLTLNALGVERSIFERLEDNDVDSVVNMMEQHDFDVDNAISEYKRYRSGLSCRLVLLWWSVGVAVGV